MRLLCLSSERLGQDWVEVSEHIDAQFPLLGMELAEENIFLIYDTGPGSVLSGEGACLIGRPVIGLRRSPGHPFKLLDWVSSKVHKERIQSLIWPEVFQEIYERWEKLTRDGKKIAPGFWLRLRRRLNEKLRLEVEIIFYE